jgi:hypothetical protein
VAENGDMSNPATSEIARASVPRSSSGKEGEGSGSLMAIFNRPRVRVPEGLTEEVDRGSLPGKLLLCSLFQNFQWSTESNTNSTVQLTSVPNLSELTHFLSKHSYAYTLGAPVVKNNPSLPLALGYMSTVKVGLPITTASMFRSFPVMGPCKLPGCGVAGTLRNIVKMPKGWPLWHVVPT